MAQFRGIIQGSRGEASRLGGKTSGLRTSCDGWNAGVDVQARTNESGQDVFRITQTGGSNGAKSPVEIGTITDGKFQPVK